MRKSLRKMLNPAAVRVLKRLHYPLDVILSCVRWYVAYPLSLRHLEEMMSEGDWTRIEQAIGVDLKVDVRTLAKSIQAPTLIITAMHDQILPPDYTDELSALIEHSGKAELDSGHLVFLEKPLDLVTAILSFYGTPAVG
jgi:pimeloyl-ACP methyl ester carboxylesterase